MELARLDERERNLSTKEGALIVINVGVMVNASYSSTAAAR